MFKPVNPKLNFAENEEQVLTYWKENNIFEKSIENRPEDRTWTFLDGPPFVTGLPHYGHLLTSIAKDLFPRFWTMKGYRVRRVWGWDGHGLPVENKVENKLEIKRKKDIEEEIGIERFIEECKKYVDQVSDEWEWYVDHVGRWVDFRNAYRTWDTPYMESVMWVFKQLYDKGYIYKGLKVSLYCPHCATPISNFEVAMDADNYKELVDPATTYKYKLEDEENTYILAWSTTPWNKIVTPALAVNPDLHYVKVKQGDEYYILAETTLKMLSQDIPYEVIEKMKGSDLVGKKFVPHYDYYPIEPGKKAFEIIPGTFVTAEEGTGVVTIAAYGEEDLQVMREQNVHIEIHLDEEGTVKEHVPQFGGMYYLKANKAVEEDLRERGLIYKSVQYPHKVPLCWRCHTRLYYAPISAWYVNIQSLKDEMKLTNENINWVPQHFKHGRFLKSLENAPDWNISRNRYWGSPVPVWECECGERFVPGSIKELEERSGKKVADLHKPHIDKITIECQKCNKTVQRVPEVLDSWIEAGSASFGERHFPFEGEEDLDSFYPPDFIVEYTGQIRAWFYVLHVISNALYKREAFENVLVNGVILGTDGRKMSKNYGNYPDPRELIQKYGGDALRLYLMSSPVVQGEDTVISEEQYRDQVRGTLLILWNVYNFFVSYALSDDWQPGALDDSSPNVLDRWILSLLNRLIIDVTEELEKYDTIGAIEKIEKFVNLLSTWYVRRSRDRVGADAQSREDAEKFYATAYYVLVKLSHIMAPITPFIAEEMYRNLTNEESVHLSNWPEANVQKIDKELEDEMEEAMKLTSLIHMYRKQHNLKVRLPLREFRYTGPREFSKEVLRVIGEETNVYEVVYAGESEEYHIEKAFENILSSDQNIDRKAGEARDIIRKIQGARKNLGTALNEYVDVSLESWPEELEEEIKKKALIRNLTQSPEFSVVRIHE